MNAALEPLLKPISPSLPTGSDGYNAIDGLMTECKPAFEQKAQEGKMVESVKEPNWGDLRAKAVKILEKESKHLRAAMILTVATAKVRPAWREISDCFELIEKLLETYWDNLYPALDGDDPYERAGILRDLASPINADDFNFVLKLQRIPILHSQKAGVVSFLEYEVTRGAASPALLGDRPPVTQAQIDAILKSLDKNALQETSAGIESILASLARINDLFVQKKDGEAKPDTAFLEEILHRIQKIVGPQLNGAEAGGSMPEFQASVGGASATPMAGAAGEGQGRPAFAIQGAIRSRAEALAALEAVIAYYDQAETSSPIPLMLRRAKSLASKNFYEILGDLTPDAIERLKIIVGDPAGSGNAPVGASESGG